MKNKVTNWLYYTILAIILLFGFYIRTKLYVASDIFEDDECRLALGMMDKSLWQMFLPIGSYSSTPIFVFISKIIGEATKYNEYALHTIPYLFSIASLGLFYKICSEYFNRKISLLIALFLFVVNYDNIYFSSVFKTYSIEVFLSLLCLYYFPKINIAELNTKQIVGLTIANIMLMLISLPSLFFIGTLFIVNICKNHNNKLFYKKFAIVLIPFLITFGLYYFYNLLPTKIMQMNDYAEYWNGVFSANIMTTIAATMQYLFRPNKYILFMIILMIVFTVFTICNKEEQNKINIYLLSVLYMSIIASFLGLYPISIGRTALYLLPLLILIMIRPLDILNIRTKSLYLWYLIFFISFYMYFTPKYIAKINDVVLSYRNYAPNSLVLEMKKKFNNKTDNVVTTQSSIFSYTFYAIKNNFIQNMLVMENEKNTYDNAREIYFKYYNSLDKNKNYWFYLIKEYELSPQLVPTLEWLKHQNIQYSHKDRESYLYYISGIKEVNP